VHHATGKAEVHGLRLANEAGQPLRSAGAGHYAKFDFRLAELGRVRGDDEVAHHRELAAAAKREASYRGDHGFAAAGDTIPRADEILLVDLHVGLRLHLLDVSAGGERFFRTGDDDAANSVVGLPGIENLVELGDQRTVESVEGLRAIERDKTNLSAGLDENVLVSHRSVLPRI